jgi:hypothetical protein
MGLNWEEFVESFPEFKGMENEECISCHRTFEEIIEESGADELVEGYWTDKGFVCYSCWVYDEENPIGWVTMYKDGEEVRGFFGHYTYYSEDDDLDELIRELMNAVYWVSTSAWRGYYEIDREKLENWAVLHSDCALIGSRDASYLEEFDELAHKFLDALGVVHARVVLRTSNVFSAGYELLVRKCDLKDVQKFMKVVSKLAELKYHYRDPVRFVLTALTGKDEFDERDYLLLSIWERVRNGEDIEDILPNVAEVITGVERTAET